MDKYSVNAGNPFVKPANSKMGGLVQVGEAQTALLQSGGIASGRSFDSVPAMKAAPETAPL